jgi:pimeloyl-ACP methyl ester carboxylesterase
VAPRHADPRAALPGHRSGPSGPRGERGKRAGSGRDARARLARRADPRDLCRASGTRRADRRRRDRGALRSARRRAAARARPADTLGLQPFRPAPEFGQALLGYLGDPDEATHDRLWERCAYDLGALRESLGERWALLKAYNLDRARAPGLAQVQHQLMADFGLPAMPGAELERISVPASLIWGRHDLATPLSVAQAAAVRYGWPLHVVDDAGDDPAMEQPEAFVQALDAAVAERRHAAQVTP